MIKKLFKALKMNERSDVKMGGLFANWQAATVQLNVPTKQMPDPIFIDNLVLQRTEPFLALGGRPALSHWMETGDASVLSEYLFQNGFLSTYIDLVRSDMNAEVDEIAKCLDISSKKNWVTIGPGNGLLELYAYKKFAFESLLLIDIEETPEKHHHGFKDSGAGYASLDTTQDFLTSNGMENCAFELCNPTKQDLPNHRFDFLLSTYSMGFHYPCDSYAAFILENCLPGGILVFDKRNGSEDNGFSQLLESFEVFTIKPSSKSDRVALIRKPAG